MTPFVILFAYLVFVWFFSCHTKDPRRKAKKQCLLSFVGLLFLLGFHHPSLGVDVVGFYVPFFERCTEEQLSFHFVGHIEPLFHAYSYCIRNFTDNEQIFLFITALFILVPVIFLFYKKSYNPWFSIFFYTSFTLYHFAFSGIRQAMAISVVCIGFYYLLEGKTKFFVALVLIATGLHISAIVSLIAYPLKKYKLSNFSWIILFLLVSSVIVIMPSLFVLIVDMFFSGAGKYQNAFDIKEGGSITLSFVYLALAILQLFLEKKNKTESMLQFTLLLFLIQLTGMRSNYASRIGFYFLPLMFIFVTNSIADYKDKDLVKFIYSAMSCFLFFFFIYANGSGYLEVIPFKFFWE